MSDTADSSPTSADSTSSASSTETTQSSGSGRIESASSETSGNAASSRQSSELKRSASQKKNQKRREAAKKKLAESAESTPLMESVAILPQVKEEKKEVAEDKELPLEQVAEELTKGKAETTTAAASKNDNVETMAPEALSMAAAIVTDNVDDKAAQTSASIARLQTPETKHPETSSLQATVISPINFSLSLTEQPYPTLDHSIWAESSKTPSSTGAALPPTENSIADASIGEERRNALEIHDPVWDVPLGILVKDFDKTESQLQQQADINTVQDVHQSQDHMPGMQPRRQPRPQHPDDNTPLETQPYLSLADNYLQNRRVISSESVANLHSWDVASETVVMVAIQCLTKDKDMELSYVAILSAINVLNSKKEHEQVQCDDGVENEQVKVENRNRVGAMYSQLVRIMTAPVMSESLTKEIERQGAMTADALYLQLYQAIVGAGFPLRDDDHVQVAQFLFDRQRMEEALACLQTIDEWYGAVFRTAISCHLFSKPRHLHEAEVLLDRYLGYTGQTSGVGVKDKANSVSANRGEEERRVDKAMVKKWFKLQLDASKWEEIRLQYERSRARLVEAPSNIERFSASAALPQEEPAQPSSCASSVHELVGCTSNGPMPRRGSTASSMTTASVKPGSISEQQQPSPAVVLNAPEAVTPTKAKRSSFSFFSKNPAKATGRRTSAPALTVGTSSIQANRHLTILDNGMLEECVNHKQFEYGWRTVYERMGPALEDKDTAKIAMRLCKRAFLGHGGLGPNLPGSPNLLARDMYFTEDDHYQGKDISDYSMEEGKEGQDDGNEEEKMKERAIETIEERIAKLEQNRKSRQDPEIWEARAWVIYNKSTMNPALFLFNATPTTSPTAASQPLSSQQQQQPSNVSATTTSVISSAAVGGSALGMKILPASSTGTTSLTVFLHNILTIAINSPEQSSRYMKAFRIYSAMRSESTGQFQAQLRDPFVMTCMVKIIYDTVLAVVRSQSRQYQHQSLALPSSQHQREESQTLPQQGPMSIGPLLDMVFEIFADMRNTGPIRILPQLCALAPLTPGVKTPRTPTSSAATSVGGPGGMSSTPKTNDGMSMFFQLSYRSRTVSTLSATTVDLSACGQDTSKEGEGTGHPCILQDLNPALSQPVGQARRLPNEIYLALLHLCIQVPCPYYSTSKSSTAATMATVSTQTAPAKSEKPKETTGPTVDHVANAQATAFQVVKTVIADMMTTKAGQQPANLDRHLAVALQYYHDHCLPLTASCRRPAPPPKASMETIALDTSGVHGESKVEERQKQECPFHGWMYQTEEEVRNHGVRSASSSSSSSFASSSTSDLHVAHGPLPVAAFGEQTISSSSHLTEEENSHYGISKHDADLDELDLYLSEAAAATAAAAAAAVAAAKAKRARSKMDVEHQDMSDLQQWPTACTATATLDQDDTTVNAKIAEALSGNWMDGLDHDTCNDRFYWDLWARESPLLQRVQFSRRRARMLWRHFANLEISE
ncbi:hypothetical protein EMPS_07696 [Entomortierella parvispora]|uniref:Uncharacterized protein n=1 Tax=Entomortierella parvispora TaxID=205924 RepID=A0A9P3LYP7_9FUNG|nr:hypothetical protein EMPS_07696 [Entomortierella parvispora]